MNLFYTQNNAIMILSVEGLIRLASRHNPSQAPSFNVTPSSTMGAVMLTNKSKSNRQEMLNHLLESIVEANGGTVESNDKNSLLKSWLESLGG